jgi:energy-coupling factor transporter ATP-binding protein EcfA2
VTFQFRPARDAAIDGTPLLIGLAGPSGGGKTYSALTLAKGIQSVVGGDIAAIDTEAKRMLRYANEFEFKYLEFGAPFSSLRYIDALKAAAATGAKTIIVDSMSHEHEGPGGYLAYHEAELSRMAGEDWQKRERVKFTAWVKPSGDRRLLINTILQIPANFIFCFRAKEKIALVKKDGKTEPVDMGWQTIAGDEFAFEMTTMCILPPRAEGVPDWKAPAAKIEKQHKAIFGEGKAITSEMGRQLAELARHPFGSAKPTAPAPQQPAQSNESDFPGDQPSKTQTTKKTPAMIIEEIGKAETVEAVDAIIGREKSALEYLKEHRPETYDKIMEKAAERKDFLRA